MNKRLLNLAVALASLAAPRLANGIDLIKWGAVFNYHKGTKEASSPRTAWTEVDVENSSWSLGRAPFFNNEKTNGGGLTDKEIRRIYDEIYNTVKGTVSLSKAWGTNWISKRRAPVLKHLKEVNFNASDQAPVFNQFGGTVPDGFQLNMTSTNGNIYCTTDSTDPRTRFTGTVSASAKPYNKAGGLSLSNGAHIKARSLNGGTWSALTEASFMVGDGSPPIRITELMYNPQGGDAFEFIELKNIGDTEVELSGFSFDGITYQFAEGSTPLAAGAYLLLVNDANVTAFRARHPGVRLDGLYDGSLSNKGERLALLDQNGETVLSVDYDDGGAWPSSPDGDG